MNFKNQFLFIQNANKTNYIVETYGASFWKIIKIFWTENIFFVQYDPFFWNENFLVQHQLFFVDLKYFFL